MLSELLADARSFKGVSDDNFPFGAGGFEQFFNGQNGMPDLAALFGQLQSLMQPYDGVLNWDAALNIARTTAAASPDPTPTSNQQGEVADALRLADHWLDDTTSFPSGVTTTDAWSRAQWIVGTFEMWKAFIEPVAATSTQSLGSMLPDEARAQSGPILGFVAKAVGAMFGSQTGTGLGTLAGEVLSVSDIGIPLAPAGRAALVPTNVAEFAAGLDAPISDVLLFVALREAAHQRLFAGVGWLRDYVITAVTDHAKGVEVNMGQLQQQIEEQMRGLDLSDPAALQSLMNAGGFQMPTSAAQKDALERLEILLALIEGWVDDVVAQATDQRMPAATKLAEAFRRRRASGGPAEQTFATLVGLELRPRRLRDAATLWGSLRTRQGVEARDGVWMSPALLPTAADLDDPLGFREGAETPEALSADEFDAELAKLLDASHDDPDTEPSSDEE